jgi:hypothetical protein
MKTRRPFSKILAGSLGAHGGRFTGFSLRLSMLFDNAYDH